MGLQNAHVVRKPHEVLLLLGELLLELQELFLLPLTDGVVLGGLLALLESITVGRGKAVS